LKKIKATDQHGSTRIENGDRKACDGGTTMAIELLHKDVTEKIIGAAFEVYRELGYGFLEAVYQRAMQMELVAKGLKAEIENKIKVYYKGVEIGHYEADIFVEDRVIVELKTAKDYNPADEAQLLNELKATGIRVGLLINFGRSGVHYKRMVF
jgi:GxxExxY protein